MRKPTKFFNVLLFFVIVVLISGNTFAQLTGTKTIPGTYASILAAITDLNAQGVGSGGVTFNIAAGYTETAANLIITATGTASNPIVFQKLGSGVNPLITAGVGVSTTLDGIIIFSGSDYITFDGIDLQENAANTTTTTQMEWGYALLKVDGTDGAQSNTVKNCVITLNKTNTNTKGIYSANHTTASTTTLTVSVFSGTNSSNKFYSNIIQNCYSGIYVYGYADASTPYAYYDHFNEIGVQGGNTIRYFGGSSTITYGIYTSYQDSLSVNNNNVAGGTGTTTTIYGLYIYYGYNSSINIYNNTVSDTTSSTTSASYGIYVYYAGNTGVDNTVNIRRNTVQGMTSLAATSAALYGYYLYYIPAYTLNIDSNKFVDNKWGGPTQTATGSIYGFYIYPYTTAPLSGSVENITNNYISGNKRTQSVLGAGTLYGMYIYYGNQTVNAYNNIIENDTLSTTTGTSYYMYVYNYYSTTVSYYDNIIRNIYRPNGTGATYGYYISNAAYTGTFNYYNNTANNIKSEATAATIYGIYNASSAVTKNMYNNTAYSLYTSSSGSVYGIYTSAGTTVNVYKNSVYDLRTSTGYGYGVMIASGTTVNVYNNYISDIRCDSISNTLALMGLYISGGTSVNAYYNTIYLNSVSTGTLFGTAAIYASTTPTVDLRNNIAVNMSTPGPTGGYSTAYYRSTATLTTYSSLSNNNDFYAGTPDTSHIIYYDGTNYMRTLSDYKGFVAPRDENSLTENPPFVNVSSRPYNLHINAATPTQCEGTGTVISAPISITDDYDGQARYPNSGYPVNPVYPPIAPDMGADEIGGIPLDLNPPQIVYTPLLNTGSTTARTLTATIIDASGVPTSGIGLPRLFWNKNSGLWDSTTAASLGSNQYSFTFGSGVVTGDTVRYYVVAQDLNSPPNVGANPSAGADNFTANPPRAGIPPTTPNSYIISASSLTGDYTVGLTLFNNLTGNNIYFDKVVKKVMKEVFVEEQVEKKQLGKGETEISETSASINPKGRKEIREVEEISWVPKQNGVVYNGPLYIKKVESPNYSYPMGIDGIYATITAAVNDLNLRGVSGPTRFLLNDASYTTGETYPIVVNVANENKPTATNTVTIKPNTGVVSTISGDAPASRIFAILTNYVSIDGSNTASGTTRDLTITNISVTTPQVLVVGSTGTTPITNVTLKNCKFINGVTTSSAIIISDGAAPGTAGWFNNITVQNNSIQLAYIGLYSIAAISSGNGSGLNIINNDIGDSVNAVRLVDVYVQGVDGAAIANNNLGKNYLTTYSSNVTGVWFATGTVNSSITDNTISDITATAGGPRGIAISSAYANANVTITGNTLTNLQTAGSTPPYGIYVFSTTSNVSIKKNKISGLLNTNTGGYGARAINIATTVSPANIDIINNFIWNVIATSDASVTYWGIGIAIDATINTVNVYANSVNLYGSYSGYSSATVHTAFYNSAGATILNIRDNIFVNSYDNTNSTTDKSYSIYCAGTNTAFTDINYCDYYAFGTPGVLGYLGGDKLTLTDWQTATGKDLNSVNGDPKFFNDSNLHIDSNQVSPVGNAGQFIATVLDDIDGNTRSVTTPDIGADEYNYQQGPLTGIRYIPGDYASIPLAITDLNTWGVGSGGVTFKVAAGKIDTAANLVINTTGTASNPIVFEKNGTGANPMIVAGVGTGALDGIIGLNGADYITFNGIDLMENASNTTTTTQMEIGYALLKVDGTNGSQNNTIKNCSITLNKTNPSTYGIYSANHTITSTTGLTVTAISGTNSNNKFYGNSIQNCYSGIFVGGFADATPYVYYDNGNEIGVQGGNTVRNFGGGSTATYGIYTTYQDSLAVSNNNIGGGTGSTLTSYGIYVYYGYNANVTVYNNTVSDTTAALTSSTYGIGLYYVGNTGVDNTVTIKRNTVQGMTNTAAGTSCALYGYYIYYTTSNTLIIDSNKFINNKWGNSTGTFTGAIYSFYNYTYTTTPAAGGVEYITNNYISGNKKIQSATSTGTHYGMYNYYGLETVNSYNNVVEFDTLTTTSTNYGIYMYHYYSTTANIHDNSVRNIYKADGSTGSYYGIYLSNAAYTGTCDYYNNSVYNISVGAASALVYGQYLAATSVTKNVYGNTVYNIQTSLAGNVYGIYQSGGTTVSLYKNRIYNLSTETGYGYGLYIASGTTNNIYNNYISDIRSGSSVNAVALYGMYISGGTTNNVYYNTIYLNSVSTGATFGTSALYTSTTPTVALRNNIIVNMSTPGSTGGNVVAYQRSSTTLTTYADSSNNNCFYAGTPSANRLIFYDGTNSDQTIAEFKTRVAPRDAYSFSENPPFVSPPTNLHLQTTIPTRCESGAKPIYVPPITDDYDGDTRNAVTPDVGADEGNFTPYVQLPSLTIKVYFEGFYSPEPTDNKQTKNDRGGDYILAQVPDTIKIYLADSLQNYAFIDSVKVFLPSTGTYTTPFTNASTGKYYIVVRHRNHLETWSKYAVSFTSGSTTSYDFTTAASQAYGDNMKQIGSVYVIYGGDPNQDGDIGALDIPIFISQFGTQGYLSCDFNGDNDVTGVDQQILIQNFGITLARPGMLVMIKPENGKGLKEYQDKLREFQGKQNDVKNNR